MLQHSTLDDIAYNHNQRNSLPSYHGRSSAKRRSIKNRHRRHRSTSSAKRKNFATDQCAVCLDESSTLDTKLFPCGHTFHGQCLIQWVTVQKGRKFNCPLCRQDIANFIQMTGNQHINEQLIAIWNEHYLCTSSTQSSNKPLGDCSKTNGKEPESLIVKTKSVESTQCACDHDHEHAPKTVDVQKEPEPLIMDPLPSITVDTEPPKEANTAIAVASNNKSDHSVWKFIWKNPAFLYKSTTPSASSQSAMLSTSPLHAVTANAVSYEETQDTQLQWYQPPMTHPVPPRRRKPAARPTKLDEPPQPPISPPLLHETRVYEEEPAKKELGLLPFTALNVQSGLAAGFCAGSTTFALTQQFRYQLWTNGAHKGAILGSLRSSLMPILSETVPSVAVFFTSYEHLKRYLCNIDTEKHSPFYTFGQRFVSAGIASSLAYYAPNPHVSGRALLPFRFATFFGTFELCKDAMSKRHDELNVMQVAGSAAVGGSIAHSLYYPLMQLKTAGTVNLSITSFPSLVSSVVADSGNIGRSVYRGWVSSWSRFLPSCVVCSCAFEYSKRYLCE